MPRRDKKGRFIKGSGKKRGSKRKARKGSKRRSSGGNKAAQARYKKIGQAKKLIRSGLAKLG